MTVENNTQDVKSQRTVVGKVVSNKMDKTIVVSFERKIKDPIYGKYVKRFTKMYAHDQDNAANIGDVVKIKLVRPLSKTKRWQLLEIMEKKQ